MIVFFFFNDTATTEIYTLSLHDALPIFAVGAVVGAAVATTGRTDAAMARRSAATAGYRSASSSKSPISTSEAGTTPGHSVDRKSTRLNSSHANISYAVFCLKKKKHNRLS